MAPGFGHSLGAQLERTVLSWNRSALAFAANGGLLAREGFVRDVPAVAAAGFAVIGLAAVLWVLSVTRYNAARTQHTTHLIAGGNRSALALTSLAVVIAVVDLAVTIA